MSTTIGYSIPGASQPKELVRLIDAAPILKNIELDIMMLHGKADELGESADAILCTKDIVKLKDFAKWLKAIPTIDPESMRPTAHWDIKETDCRDVILCWRCDKCGRLSRDDYPYCPNCGARMEGRRDE